MHAALKSWDNSCILIGAPQKIYYGTVKLKILLVWQLYLASQQQTK